MSAQWYDANISIPGCDKNMPGCVIAMGRLNRPSLMIYGGTIRAGCRDCHPKLDIVSAFQCYGEYIAGKISDAERQEIVEKSCPGAGACGGMYTANTMASAIEAMGMSLPYSSSIPAEDPLKHRRVPRSGRGDSHAARKEHSSRSDIMTRAAFENAMVVIMATGRLDQCGAASARHGPRGRCATDHRRLSEGQRSHPVHRRPQAERQVRDGRPALRRRYSGGDEVPAGKRPDRRKLSDGHRQDDRRKPGSLEWSRRRASEIIAPIETPIKESGHIRIMRGNFCPDGAVAKITGKEGLKFSGPARVFDSEEDMLAGLEKQQIQKGDVIIIRYEGPKGGPGCRRC